VVNERIQLQLVEAIRWTLLTIAAVLFVAGSLTLLVLLLPAAPLGWLLPQISVRSTELDAFLAADITAIAVLVAIVSAQGLGRLGAETVAWRQQARADVFAFICFFGACAINLVVALFLLLRAPAYDAQVWAVWIWFLAILLLTVFFLATLGLRDAYVYPAYRFTRALARRALAEWEALSVYADLLTLLLAAFARRNLLVTERVTGLLGPVLAAQTATRRDATTQTSDDRSATRRNESSDDRADFRALENLLTAALDGSLHAAETTHTFGALMAGVLLASAASGLDAEEGAAAEELERNVFRRVFRTLRQSPDTRARIEPLLAGLRFALCRPSSGGVAYLRLFLRSNQKAPQPLGGAVGRALGDVYAQSRPLFLADARDQDLAQNDALDADLAFVQALLDLYRDLVYIFVTRTKGGARTAETTFVRDVLTAANTRVTDRVATLRPAAAQRLKTGYQRYLDRLRQ
jgi:hypothetical protein